MGNRKTDSTEFKYIGKRIERLDAYEKVTGKAIYGDDLRFCDMLYAAQRYTDIPCGKIVKLDLSDARKVKGVKEIVLYKDIPGKKRTGAIRADHFPLVNDEVFYSGDVVAAVAADSKEAARMAADLIRIDYEPIKGIFDPQEAMLPESRLIHPEFKSNIMVHYPLRKGNVAAGFAESDLIIERKYRTGFAEHAYIEPETVTVEPDPNSDGFNIFGSIQNPYTTRKVVTQFMGLKQNQINICASTLGGSFGGKDDIISNMACRCALLAARTGKAVKLTLTREESIKESYKRHPYNLSYKVGFMKDGILKAMKIKIVADCGAYSSQTFFVTWRSVVQATGPYEIKNVETDIFGVYTNNTYTAAFRGFGSPQVIFAQESLMDEIAALCHLSPLEIRKKNGYRNNSITASGQRLDKHQVSLFQVMDSAIQKAQYQDKIRKYKTFNQSSSRFKLGIGLSCSFRGCSLGAEGIDATSAIVSVLADGSVYLMSGLNENGQGMRTAFAQIAAEVLGISPQDIVFLSPRTSTITDGGPTVASRATLTGGNAVLKAAEEIKSRIFLAVKAVLCVQKIDDTRWENGEIYSSIDPQRKISFSSAAEKCYQTGINLSAYGWWKGPKVSWNENSGQGDAYFTYVYGCQVAEIKLDTFTGKIEMEKITAAHDVGKVINKTGAEGQITGGITQGFGYAVLEDYNIQDGVVKSLNFDEYLIPTIKDIKEIDPILIENKDPAGPFGAKSLGEPTLELTAAAINNAFRFITGFNSSEIPLNLEKIFLNKHLHKPKRESESTHFQAEEPTKKLIPRLSDLKTYTPSNLQEALNLIAADDWKILAGGTDLIISLRKRTGKHNLLNIFNLKELQGCFAVNDVLRLKAGTTFTQILADKAVGEKFPLLWEACSQIGSTQIRNRATIGGNIVNAAPCADSVPPLLLYNAELILQWHQGKRTVPAAEFIKKNYQTITRQNEILTEIILPIPVGNYRYAYYKLGRRNALNITRMSFAAMIDFANEQIRDCRLACGSMFSKPLRLNSVEEFLEGEKLEDPTIEKALMILEKQIEQEIGNRWSSEYKKPVFLNIVRDLLKQIQTNRSF